MFDSHGSGAPDDDFRGRRHMRGEFHPFGRHGFRGGMGTGPRLGRLFAHGDLHLLILHLVAERPRHGYDIIKAVEELAGGRYAPSPGTVYPALTMLEERNLIAVEENEGNKKLYAVTGEGRAYLAANQGAVEALLARVRAAADSHGLAPQIVRAMENLHLALHLRLSSPLDAEQVQKAAAILDRAAREIEEV